MLTQAAALLARLRDGVLLRVSLEGGEDKEEEEERRVGRMLVEAEAASRCVAAVNDRTRACRSMDG